EVVAGMWQASTVINKLTEELSCRFDKRVVRAFDEPGIFTESIVLAQHKQHDCCLVFLNRELPPPVVNQLMPGAADGAIRLVLMHQVTVTMQGAACELKERSGLAVDTKTHQRPDGVRCITRPAVAVVISAVVKD